MISNRTNMCGYCRCVRVSLRPYRCLRSFALFDHWIRHVCTLSIYSVGVDSWAYENMIQKLSEFLSIAVIHTSKGTAVLLHCSGVGVGQQMTH